MHHCPLYAMSAIVGHIEGNRKVMPLPETSTSAAPPLAVSENEIQPEVLATITAILADEWEPHNAEIVITSICKV